MTQSRRILIVEDNRDLAAMLQLVLEEAGHQVYLAYDGSAGLEAYQEHRPEVMLVDIGLPDIDGIAVGTEVRKQSASNELLLITMTGFSDPAYARRSKEAGFDHHFTKPMGIKDLRQIVETWVPSGRALTE